MGILLNYISRIYFFAKKGAYFFYSKTIKLNSKNEDLRRKELILNILLAVSMLLSFSAVARVIINLIETNGAHLGASLNSQIIIFLIFIFVFILSRFQFLKIASLFLIAIYFLSATYAIIYWGADLPQGLLIYALVITMAGILISARFSLFAIFLVSVAILSVSYLQINSILIAKSYWRNELFLMEDMIIIIFTLGIIMIISWISSKEIEKSLKRAQFSEAELKNERDLLESRIEERTRELKETQIEKALQLYRFAEFGKMSAGLFHDLVNPITSVILNIENLKRKFDGGQDINEKDLGKASESVLNIKTFTEAARKQIQNQETHQNFSLQEEASLAVSTLSFKARRKNIKLKLFCPDPIYTFGDPTKFYRLICDLISNSIDAYDTTKNYSTREVRIDISKALDKVALIIQDWGDGIPSDVLPHIFEPLFTTKPSSEGMGLGLFIVKNIVEKNLRGTITVKSEENKGTIFNITFSDNQQ